MKEMEVKKAAMEGEEMGERGKEEEGSETNEFGRLTKWESGVWQKNCPENYSRFLYTSLYHYIIDS